MRLKAYDYSQAGAYFITICCADRKYRFGNVENREMILNESGIIAYNEWAKLPDRFPSFDPDVFQIMPNHMHGIIILKDPPGNSNPVRAGFTPAPSIPNNNNPAPLILNNNHPAQKFNPNKNQINPTQNQINPSQKEHNDYGIDKDHDRATARVAPAGQKNPLIL